MNWGRKRSLLKKELQELTEKHREACGPYANILKGMGYDPQNVEEPEDIPFFPVRLFKEMDLLSINREDVFKTMTSSGTTSQAVSKIFVDKETAMIQQKVRIRILMMVIDTPSVMKDRMSFTARGAVVIGLQMMSRDTVYVLNDDMSLNYRHWIAFSENIGIKNF